MSFKFQDVYFAYGSQSHSSSENTEDDGKSKSTSFTLKSLCLSAKQGELVAIIGPSGAGKSSFLAILGTHIKPGTGQILVLGEDPEKISASALRRLRSKIGFVHQVPPIPLKQRVITAVLAGRLGQWSTLRSLISLLYPLDIAGVRNCLEQVQMDPWLFSRCDKISGGQLQRVGVARVLYQGPQLILADEPVSSLDPQLSITTIQALINQAQSTGATLVASLHAVDIALRWFPRILGMRAGEILFDLPSAQVTEPMLAELYEAEKGQIPKQIEF